MPIIMLGSQREGERLESLDIVFSLEKRLEELGLTERRGRIGEVWDYVYFKPKKLIPEAHINLTYDNYLNVSINGPKNRQHIKEAELIEDVLREAYPGFEHCQHLYSKLLGTRGN